MKGISLFVVPKFMVNDDGSLGERNAVSCGSIEHKMGIHGNSTCVMNYDGATGWLVGEAEKGLAAMFIMMNAARLGVGLQGLAQGEVAYQNAVAYAKDRRQGRALKPEDRDADAKADNLFVHPDVRRMLMEGRAFNEAARALILWGALQVDLSRKAQTEEERADRRRPHLGADPGDQGLSHRPRVRDRGQCPAGVRRPRLYPRMGHGAVRPRRPHRPDLRRHQRRAGDRPGRAQAGQGRRARRARLVRRDRRATSPRPRPAGDPAGLAAPLEEALGHLQASTMWLAQNGMADPNNAGAGAYAYMQLMGLVSLGWMWLKMAGAAQKLLAEGGEDKAFLEAKLTTARFFAARELVAAGALRRKVEAGADSVMALPVEAF